MRCCKQSAFLVVFQLLLGIVITAVTCYLADFSRNLPARDTPYWAGLPLVVTGIVGVIFLTCCLKDYPESSSAFCIKTGSSVLSAISACACLTAAVFSTMHLFTINQFKVCERSETVPHHSPYDDYPNLCLCSKAPSIERIERVYGYDVQKCEEVYEVLYVLFLVVAVTSSLAALCSILYLTIMWLTHYDHFYAGRKVITSLR